MPHHTSFPADLRRDNLRRGHPCDLYGALWSRKACAWVAVVPAPDGKKRISVGIFQTAEEASSAAIAARRRRPHLNGMGELCYCRA